MSWSECCGCVMAFSAACLQHMMVQYCCGSGISFISEKVILRIFEAYGNHSCHE